MSVNTIIISSQRYLDEDIVAQKIELLRGETTISLPVYDCPEYDCGILYNGHHTLAAARELGLVVSFYFVEHPEGLTGDNLLDQVHGGDDYYDIDNGIDFF